MSTLINEMAPEGEKSKGVAIVPPGKLKYFEFGKEDISAIVCSTNAAQADQTYPLLSCSQSVADSPSIFPGEEGKSVVVRCPKKCAENRVLGNVVGTGVYKDTRLLYFNIKT
eukprot:GHVR01095878.1.p3 GENE.GHVR01095878.1~~GHVR01095878.1.p3  ORF type:complete len:112 (+),score=7.07 GHVR01095878.1:1914-2249(+)